MSRQQENGTLRSSRFWSVPSAEEEEENGEDEEKEEQEQEEKEKKEDNKKQTLIEVSLLIFRQSG